MVKGPTRRQIREYNAYDISCSDHTVALTSDLVVKPQELHDPG